MAITDRLEQIIAGNVFDGAAKIISLFKVDPTKALEHQAELAQITKEITVKTIDATQTEMLAAADVIKAEANSQSWLPRNVRPLLMLLWGLVITLNAVVPIIARFWVPGLQPFPLDPWVYKLTAIGFTGYVTARTIEKLTDKAEN